MGHYDQLISYHDENTDPPVTCASEFLGKNRMEITINTFQYSKNIWDQANCDNCYDSSLNFSTDTKAFFDADKNYSTCVTNASKESNNNYTVICSECVKNYLTLNEKYEKIKDSFGYYKTCFDIQDKVSCLF